MIANMKALFTVQICLDLEWFASLNMADSTKSVDFKLVTTIILIYLYM